MLPDLQFPPEEFDRWAAHYDQNVSVDSGFPFDGYARVLDTIVEQAGVTPGAWVLDLGTGTGNLAQLFARRGCTLWGLDFSAPMLEKAQRKLPEAQFAQVDIRTEWPPEFRRCYHAIVSGYTLHHFPLQEKVELVTKWVNEYLLPGGCLLVGDIAFQDAAEEDALRQAMGSEWEQEYFWLADETLAAFAQTGMQAGFVKISSCAGVFRFTMP